MHLSHRHLAVCLAAALTAAAPHARATPPLPPPSHWPPAGLTVSRQPGEQWILDVVSDDWNTSAFVAWLDRGKGEDSVDIHLQRVTSLGGLVWDPPRPGSALCTAAGRQFMARLAPDGLGGVMAAWYDERGPSPDIYMQRVRWDGRLYSGWPADGLPVCSAPGAQTEPIVVSNGNQGAYLAWEDSREGASSQHVYVQRVAAHGGPDVGWPDDGVRVSDANRIEMEPSITTAPDGGLFVTWVRREADGSNGDIVATRLTPYGLVAPGWPDSGRVLCAARGMQDMPSMVADRDGGFYVVWRDYRDEADLSGENRSDIYAQHVTGPGDFAPGWGGDGLAIRVDAADQWIPKIAADGLGGLLVSWWSGTEVFVQRVAPEGTVAPGWAPGGVSVGTTTAVGQGPVLTGDGAGGAIVAWNEYHPSSLVDVYAQRILSNGGRAPGWPASGVPVARNAGMEQIGGGTARVSSIVTDGMGGALVVWNDLDAPFGAEVMMQRVTSVGLAGPWDCYGCNALVSLSPNPGTGAFRLGALVPSNRTSAVVEVYDVLGRKVRTRSFEGLRSGGRVDLDVDLSGLPAGVYFLRFAGGPGLPRLGSRSVVLVR